MKKKRNAIVSVLLACSLVFSFGLLSACEFYKPVVSDDSTPYDVAVSRGEAGSRDSWLASLETPTTEYRRAYEEAIGDGSFSGTYFEFLEQLGIENDNGARVQKSLLSAVSIVSEFEAASGGKSYASAGSGVIYSLDSNEGDAYIVTNYHVVYDEGCNAITAPKKISRDISVYLYGSENASGAIGASYVGGAMDYDIAVLKVDNCEQLKATQDNTVYAREAVAANSDCLTVGEEVFAIGNAEGVGMSVTKGVISVDFEYIDIYAANETDMLSLPAIRTDAAVNHGNSGGGLFNASGELIGIVNARDESEGVTGFGYAIPVNLAFALAQNIIDTCTANPRNFGAAQARLGVTAQVASSRGVYNEQTGKVYLEEKVIVGEVDYLGMADNVGIKAGDTLISAKLTSSRGGEPYEREQTITRMFQLTNLLMEVRFGDVFELTVSRDNELVTFTLNYNKLTAFRSLK